MHAPESALAATQPLDAAATTDALERAAVVRWWQTTAFLEVAGPDAASFLDGLCTQAVERIEVGNAVLGLFLDAKAKIIAPVLLHRSPNAPWTDPRRSDETPEPAPRLLLETLPELVEPLHAHLSRYRLRAKASVEAVDLATIAVAGATAEALELPDGDGGTWTSVGHQVAPTRAFVGTPEDCAALVSDQLPRLGVLLADPDAFEAARITAGIAGLHDLLPGRMPAEVGGMDSAVALDAGCYLGQEPVARLHYRGHANRTLRRLVSTEPIAPSSGEESAFELRPIDASDDARPSGRLTTWATHPDGATMALAMLRREVPADAEVRLPGGGGTFRTTDAAPE